LVKINAALLTWKKVPRNVRYFCNLKNTAQSKQSPNGRKFAQSGHPAAATNLIEFCQSGKKKFLSRSFVSYKI
jgi:hypothetical protein